MRKKLTIDKWYGWMSSDPSVWGVGSFYDGRGVEIRKDSKKVSMNGNSASLWNNVYSESSCTIVWAIMENSTLNLYATSNGKLGNTNDAENRIAYTDSTYTTVYNIRIF